MPAKLEAALARELAVKASVDPKTILKAARGEHVSGMAGHRARAALKEAGVLDLDAPPPKR
jgi:hypothetical protein